MLELLAGTSYYSKNFQVASLPEYEKSFDTSFYTTNFVVLLESPSLVSNLAMALRYK